MTLMDIYDLRSVTQFIELNRERHGGLLEISLPTDRVKCIRRELRALSIIQPGERPKDELERFFWDEARMMDEMAQISVLGVKIVGSDEA